MSGPSLYYREIKACNVSFLDNVVDSGRIVARQVVYRDYRSLRLGRERNILFHKATRLL